jgi:hypothetical protein
MLAHVVGECWHAFHRDVLTLPGRDINSLSLAEMVSVVVGAPPGSAIRHWLDDGWTRTDHLLANQQELRAGVATMSEPYQRPGVDQRVDDPAQGTRFFPAEVITWEEADRRDKERYAKAAKAKPGATRVRTI